MTCRLRTLQAIVFASLVALMLRSAPAGAGTTGSLVGQVVDATAPASGGRTLAGAKVTVASPSQIASQTTDASGNFAFISLAPDSYTVTVEKSGYDPAILSGVSISADQTQRLSLRAVRSLRTIASVRTRANGALLRPGTTSDVYSVDPLQAAKAATLGGGGNLNSAYSAIASVPGAYVPTNQSGPFQNISIRGGDYEQVGYELDGVPINKAFDNYPGSTLSSLGQQELQVYTGPPVNAEASGSSGFINQVIRTGTYPGFREAELGLGGPQYYHKASVETGGATSNRNFSYYAGLLGYDQDFRYYDQFNGASQSALWGPPLVTAACPNPRNANYASCYASGIGPAGYVLGPYQAGQVAHIADREFVANFHVGIPHAHGSLKDDVQFLYDTGNMTESSYNSLYDWGGASTFLSNGLSVPSLPSGLQYHGRLGAPLPSNYAGLIATTVYPHSNLAPDSLIPAAQRDVQIVDQSIFKLQYQRNLSQSAYLRLYAYSAYSDRYLYAPFELNLPFGNAAGAQNIAAPDYEVTTHTRGLSATFADQIGSQNLLSVLASATTAGSLRDNNAPFGNANRTMAVVVNAKDPTSGICYSVAGTVGTPSACSSATTLTFAAAKAGAALHLAGSSCGGGPCEYYVAEDGTHGSYNSVQPVFLAAAVTDSWKPTTKLTIDAALRFDSYQYDTADTGGPARDFWFNAWNASQCISNIRGTSPISKGALGIGVLQPCSTASTASTTYSPATLYNVTSPVYRFAFLEPRLGATFAGDRDDVYRFSFGKYTQPSASAFAQYNTHQQDLPDFIGPEFYKYGYVQPGHAVPPDTTYNFDASWEHQVRGTDVSLKLTPFYRRDFNENQGFYINAAQGFSSGLPIALSSIRGFELALRKGDFARNGVSGQLSYTYTYSTVHYLTLANGTTPLTPINNDIKQYNAYTSFCAGHPGDSRCGLPTKGGTSSACYAPAAGGGAASASCTAAGAYANPYWNAPVQPLLDEGAAYFPTDPIVAGVTLQANSYNVPHIAALVLNYKHDRFSITPTVQFLAGQRYGVPESVVGIDPAAGCTALGKSPLGDPRYPYGAAGGAAYDATTCAAALNAVPDPYTGKFDAIGAFVAPSQLLGSLQMSYAASKNMTLTLSLTNVLNQCFGGSREAWTGLANPKTCSYQSGGTIGSIFPSANFYNPGSTKQPFLMPYIPQFGQYVVNNGYAAPSSPFNVFLSAALKL